MASIVKQVFSGIKNLFSPPNNSSSNSNNNHNHYDRSNYSRQFASSSVYSNSAPSSSRKRRALTQDNWAPELTDDDDDEPVVLSSYFPSTNLNSQVKRPKYSGGSDYHTNSFFPRHLPPVMKKMNNSTTKKPSVSTINKFTPLSAKNSLWTVHKSTAKSSLTQRLSEKDQYKFMVDQLQDSTYSSQSQRFSCFSGFVNAAGFGDRSSGSSSRSSVVTDIYSRNSVKGTCKLKSTNLSSEATKASALKKSFALIKSNDTHEDLRSYVALDSSTEENEEESKPVSKTKSPQQVYTKTSERKSTPYPNRIRQNRLSELPRLYSTPLNRSALTGLPRRNEFRPGHYGLSISSTPSSPASQPVFDVDTSNSTPSSRRTSSEEVVEIPQVGDYPSKKSSDSDDDLKILSESILNPGQGLRRLSTFNSLALETSQSIFADKKRSLERSTHYREEQKRREDNIRHERKTLDILKAESDVEADLSKKIRRNLTITDIIVLEEQEPELPKITEEMQNDIQRVLKYGREDEVFAKAFNIEITRGDLKTLIPCKWLNDNVINTYMDMIADRSQKKKNEGFPSVHVFTTFFYPKFMKENYSNVLKRWTRKVDIFSFDLLFFPIHLGIHWCLAAVDIRKKSIQYYDSLLGNQSVPQHLLRYLTLEMKERKQIDLIPGEWNLQLMKEIPTQENGSDCGMFACKFAEYLSRDVKPTFKQENMDYFRHRMMYEIIRQDLLYP